MLLKDNINTKIEEYSKNLFNVPEVKSRGRPSLSKTSDLFWKRGIQCPLNERLQIELKPLAISLRCSPNEEKFLNDWIMDNFCKLLAKNTNNISISSQIQAFSPGAEIHECILQRQWPPMLNAEKAKRFMNEGKKVLMPTHKPGHWYMIICTNKCAFLFDSMCSDVEHAKNVLKKVFKSSTKVVKVMPCSKQTNGWSCGLYALLFGYKSFLRQDLQKINPSMVLCFREYVLGCLKGVSYKKFCSNCFVSITKSPGKCSGCDLPFCRKCLDILINEKCPQC